LKFATAGTLLILVAGMATLILALRTSRTDPVQELRLE
jgi:hypothetical protein